MLNPLIDNNTKDFILNAQGNIVNANSVLTEMFMRLETPQGSYFYDRLFGSRIYEYKN